MNGSAGSIRPKKQEQELTGSNGDVPASEKESGDPVVGLAVSIVEIITIRHTCSRPGDGVYAGLTGLCGSLVWRGKRS